MAYEWPDLTFPPLNLWNFPYQSFKETPMQFTDNSFNSSTTHTVYDTQMMSWSDLAEEFQNFLKARGYIFDVEFSFKDVLSEAHEKFMDEKYGSDEVVEKKVAKKAV